MAEQLPLPLRRWLIQLGKLTANSISSDEAAEYIDTHMPMLEQRFPPAAFTLDSLDHVASQCKYLPTYGEICEALGEWWRFRKPQQAIAYQPPEPSRIPTAEERAHASWAAAQAIAAIRSSAQPVEERRPPKPRHLTQEQLVRAYQQAGIQPPKRSA